MARGSPIHKGVAGQPEDQPAAGHHDLALLGGPPTQHETAVHPVTAAPRPRGPITTANVLKLVEWQGYRCALTGRPLTPETASLDHIVSGRCGGEHCMENVQVLHKEVNRAKATMTNEEFMQLCREVVEHMMRQQAEGEEP